jgi:uracil-DNA glycosylase
MTGIEHCPGCPYREFGPAIGSRGDPAGRVVIVGEAPGKQEILQGRPFVGPAGEILRKALSKARLVEADLFITIEPLGEAPGVFLRETLEASVQELANGTGARLRGPREPFDCRLVPAGP